MKEKDLRNIIKKALNEDFGGPTSQEKQMEIRMNLQNLNNTSCLFHG